MFKVGDEVVCTEKHDGNENIIDKSGEIAAYANGEYLVVFNEDVCGHEGWIDGEGRAAGTYGDCWWIPGDKLEFVNFTLENE